MGFFYRHQHTINHYAESDLQALYILNRVVASH